MSQGAILLEGFKVGGWVYRSYAETGFFDVDKPLKDWSQSEFDKLIYAQPEKVGAVFNGSEFNMNYEGIVTRFVRQNIKTAREKSDANQKKLAQFVKEDICRLCHGKRYSQRALDCKIDGVNIADLTAMQLTQMVQVLSNWVNPDNKTVVMSVIERVQRLIDVGLDYVSLDRETSTLSGGESQRVKMVKYLSSSLVDVCYVFDEPSIGLHARDVHRLNELLISLRDKGNTVVVVEHDPDVIKIADCIVDVGPKAGKHGGTITYRGDYSGLLQSNTLTGQALSRTCQLNAQPRQATEFCVSSKSSLHNLKDISLRVPKGVFTCVTGVAGSGKSTLVNQVFAKQFDVVKVDQSSVAGNVRSNPATYVGIMDSIRKLFAKTNNVKPGMFSYNSEGSCHKCGGVGVCELNLSFMESTETVCDECNGTRYASHVLEYKYKGIDIVQVNNMTIQDAVEFFDTKDIVYMLHNLVSVGLGYMTLGQSLNTLSGGECQRIKLAKELSKKGNIYILDEPTTGLHLSDISNILRIINQLVDSGNTVVVIEHNLELIKSADWIIDIGPEGGDGGGNVVFEGTVQDLLTCEQSYTAKYIKK
jgi:excinuclease UvrABC ATPase subunit